MYAHHYGNRLSTCAIKLLGGLCFVLKRMTPPNLFLGSWASFTGGKRTASTQRRQQEEAEWFCTQCKQEGRCGVTFAHCCCGSRDVEASFWQTAVASAGTLPVVVAALAMKLHRFEGGGGCQTSPPFSAEAKWFSHMPWWSANPPLFQRGG